MQWQNVPPICHQTKEASPLREGTDILLFFAQFNMVTRGKMEEFEMLIQYKHFRNRLSKVQVILYNRKNSLPITEINTKGPLSTTQWELSYYNRVAAPPK